MCIVEQTNLYTSQVMDALHYDKWSQVTADEICAYFGVPAIQQSMPLNRFWAIWSTIHVVDNDVIDSRGCPSAKIKPILTTLSETFLKYYSPGQELSVDETMVKYKVRCKGKVRMPK